jgi:Secretion system C-terminal sorting domain
MKTKLLLGISILLTNISFAQFSTGVVSLTANRTVKIDTNATQATLTLTGPAGAWLGIGFGGSGVGMSSVFDFFIWNATANRDYSSTGGTVTPSADAAASQSWTIVSDVVAGTQRTVVATRALVSAGDYTFVNDASSIQIIYAQGSTTSLAYHGNNPHAPQLLTRTQLGIEDFSLSASVIYPNPTNGNFTVTTKSALNEITIYSHTGSLVKTIKVDEITKANITVEGLQSGVYLLELKNDTDKSWKKIIIE